jgi:hypothetical protein
MSIEKGCSDVVVLLFLDFFFLMLPLPRSLCEQYEFFFSLVGSEKSRASVLSYNIFFCSLSNLLPFFFSYDVYSFSVIPTIGELVAGDRQSYQYLVESIRRFPNQVMVLVSY